jgi:hypothetical protein
MLSANSLLAAAFGGHSVRQRRESCRRRIRSIKSVDVTDQLHLPRLTQLVIIGGGEPDS